MPTHKQGDFVHVPRAYNEPQETMTDIRRALRMYEILSQWDDDQKAKGDTVEKINKVNKIPDMGISK